MARKFFAGARVGRVRWPERLGARVEAPAIDRLSYLAAYAVQGHHQSPNFTKSRSGQI
jgi:hypothetical protein